MWYSMLDLQRACMYLCMYIHTSISITAIPAQLLFFFGLTFFSIFHTMLRNAACHHYRQQQLAKR